MTEVYTYPSTWFIPQKTPSAKIDGLDVRVDGITGITSNL